MAPLSKDLAVGAVAVLTLSVTALNCRQEAPENFVARVDQTYLRHDELPPVRDTSQSSRSQTLEYINSWVASEILYQEAVRRGLADTEEIRKHLEGARKRLAINVLLDRDVYASDSVSVSDTAVRSLFASAGQELRLREDVANISYVLFAKRESANEFRTRILRGASWKDALSRFQGDSALQRTVRRVVNRQYVTRSSLFPEELWRLVRSLQKEEVSFVLSTDAGSYVLLVHGFKQQGEMPDLDYVQDELRERLLIEQRRQLYEGLLSDLRARHTVEVRLPAPDTTGKPEKTQQGMTGRQ